MRLAWRSLESFSRTSSRIVSNLLGGGPSPRKESSGTLPHAVKTYQLYVYSSISTMREFSLIVSCRSPGPMILQNQGKRYTANRLCYPKQAPSRSRALTVGWLIGIFGLIAGQEAPELRGVLYLISAHREESPDVVGSERGWSFGTGLGRDAGPTTPSRRTPAIYSVAWLG